MFKRKESTSEQLTVSTLHESYNQVRKNFCFYLDLQDNGLARILSKRIETLGLRQEVFLTNKVSHIIRDCPLTPSSSVPLYTSGPGGGPRWARNGARSRTDAMLMRVQSDVQPVPQQPQGKFASLTVQKAVILLDKIYDTFFTVRKPNIRYFKKHFIKIEFLDKLCRPVFREFDEWPEISVVPDPPRKRETPETTTTQSHQNNNTIGQKMTRKSKPRIKEKEEPKGGYCEMCSTEYVNATLHRRSPHHLAFVRDHTNFLALDSLIGTGADVTTFLDKATPINGERRSLRKTCNGDMETPKTKRVKRSQSPDSTINGDETLKCNGDLDDERKHNTRCSKRSSESQLSEDRQYYKVIGVSTKLRSSGGFMSKQKDSPPTVNGTKPIVVKFRKIRKSELSVLSDEAEQFMFPRRASSSISNSSDDEDNQQEVKITPQPPLTLERRRLAAPIALKEESSEEDSWPEDKRRRKRRVAPVVRRTRRFLSKNATTVTEPEPEPEPAKEPDPPVPVQTEVSPLRDEPVERCMKWEDGKLKYTPAVEQLEFAFESVPHSEPWYETFKRQDQDKVVARNVSQYFSLYSKSPKLPYEIGQLPPLKPNCCHLSDLVKRDDKAGPSRSYGTRGMKMQKIKKRTAAAALVALESHPRKSPREHASTLAILGSSGLIHRRKNTDDSKSTASEDTTSETLSNTKIEPVISRTQETSERLQQFLSEVYDDAAEYDMSDEPMEGEAAVTTSTTAPDVLSLLSECDSCDIIRDEIREGATQSRPKVRRGRFKKKKNRTGWPSKKKLSKKEGSRSNSTDHKESSLDRSSAEPPDDDTTQDSVSEAEETIIETECKDGEQITLKTDDDSNDDELMETVEPLENDKDDSDADSLQLDVKGLLGLHKAKPEKHTKKEEKSPRSSSSENEEDKVKVRKKRSLPIGDWLQPIVRVARVDPNAARKLRSSGRGRKKRVR